MITRFRFKTDTIYAGVEDGIPETSHGREGHIFKGEIVPHKFASSQGLILVKTLRGLYSLPAKHVERIK